MRKFKKKGIVKLMLTHILIFAMLVSLFPLYTLQSFAIEYPTELVNGSFEYPSNLSSTGAQWWTYFYPYDTTGHSAGTYNSSSGNGTVPLFNPAEFGWDTTATGTNRVFEFGSDSNSPTADWGVKFVPDGSQFIELNASEAAAVYQDIQTTPGQVIYWSLYQGGVWYTSKQHLDNTMAVRIGTPDTLVTETMKDANQTIFDQEWANRTIYEIDNMTVASALPAPYVSKDTNKKELFTEPKRWTKYEGIYVVPEGQTVTRFAFASRSADPLSGNLLDGVVFRTATESEISTLTSYTVTFDGNGSDGGSTLTQAINRNETHALTANGYTKTGYRFAGWNTKADGTGTHYQEGANYTATENATLFAEWLSTSCDISSFIILAPFCEGDINGSNISITLPSAVDVTSLQADVIVSPGATVFPESDDITDFTSPVTYTVTAEDGVTTKNYTVTVVLEPDPNTDIALVGSAKDAASNANYADMTQAAALNETVIENALKASAEAAVNNLAIATSITKTSYTAPIAGTSSNHAGVNGKYEFTVTVQKGVVSYTTEVKQIGIVATPYVEINQYNITGKVIDETPSDVQGAIVRIMNGQNQVGLSTLTANDGTFTIANVLSGTYNLVISKGGSVRTKVITVNNTNFDLGDVVLTASKTNSIVEVKTNTPPIVVGGLDDQFNAAPVADKFKGITALDNTVITNGGSVEIKLIADKKDNSTSNASSILATASSNGRTVGIFLDLSVLKTVKDNLGAEVPTQSATLSELPSLIEVLIPLDASLRGKSNYVIYRYHGSTVENITTTANSDGEKVELIENGTVLKLKLKKFSTYAIAYNAPVPSNVDNNSSVESTLTSPQITVIASAGGKISIGQDKKTGTILPEDGYVIADVLVDEKSVGPVETYTFTDNKNHKITASFVKVSSLPYYMNQGNKVYIGLSAVVGKTYKYIAPKGVTVLFSENAKTFRDNTIEWAKPSIDFVTEREILNGTSPSLFSPKVSMTRAMFVTAIGKIYESSYGTISGLSHFSDVDATAYYAKYVAWANDNRIIMGKGNNIFAPDEEVTREQMAVIMLNFARFLDSAVQANQTLGFSDRGDVSSWATEGVQYCQQNALITGTGGGYFKPQSNATRAEVAVILNRFISEYMK